MPNVGYWSLATGYSKNCRAVLVHTSILQITLEVGHTKPVVGLRKATYYAQALRGYKNYGNRRIGVTEFV